MNSSGTARENQTESRHSHTNIGNNKPIRLALPHTRWRRMKKKKEKDMWKRMDEGERKGERKECVWICIRNMNKEKKTVQQRLIDKPKIFLQQIWIPPKICKSAYRPNWQNINIRNRNQREIIPGKVTGLKRVPFCVLPDDATAKQVRTAPLAI